MSAPFPFNPLPGDASYADAYLDDAVAEEDRIASLDDEPEFFDDSEDYYRSMIYGEDI
jgi:hypothetical protein